MPPTTKSQRAALRRGVYRSSIELPIKVWEELQAALVTRAAKLKSEHGVEVNASFSAWLREKAEETIAAFK